MKTAKFLALFALLICSAAARAQTIPTCTTSFELYGSWYSFPYPCFYLVNKPSVPIALPAGAAPAWGTTEAQVQALFPYNMLVNFSENPNLDAMVSGMDDVMIARLSTELAANDVSDYTYSIMAYAGERLSAANLHRLAAAFGPQVFATALAYMPAGTLAAYNAAPSPAPSLLSEYWAQLNPAAAPSAPSIGARYLYDLFLNAYTAGAGGPPAQALAAASRYVNAQIKMSFAEAVGFIAAVVGLYESATRGGAVADAWNAASDCFAWYKDNQFPSQAAMVIQIPQFVPDPITPPPLPDFPAIEDGLLVDLVCFDVYEEGC
jgi:hypothetical protein